MKKTKILLLLACDKNNIKMVQLLIDFPDKNNIKLNIIFMIFSMINFVIKKYSFYHKFIK